MGKYAQFPSPGLAGAMTTVRPFRARDLFAFNNVNMDHWTETYSNGFYLSYLAQWPDMALTACAAQTGAIMGYVLGKAEGKEPTEEDKRRNKDLTLHGHVTAVTVAHEYRRLGVAQMLMDFFEYCSEHVYRGFFVDLFVRPSNAKAMGMYKKRGYSVYRRVHAYYQGTPPKPAEDGFGMFFHTHTQICGCPYRGIRSGRRSAVMAKVSLYNRSTYAILTAEQPSLSRSCTKVSESTWGAGTGG